MHKVNWKISMRILKSRKFDFNKILYSNYSELYTGVTDHVFYP